MDHARKVGDLLRDWRLRRGLSQLELACEAEISTRHLSFVETGRARPSAAMVQRLAERLNVPMRERNALLLAAGFAPAFPERALDVPAMQAARGAVALVLRNQLPYPAFALDRHWTIIESNGALPELYDGVAQALLQPPVNVLRLALHPDGLAPRIRNLAEVRGHLLGRLRQQIAASGDATLSDLLAELQALPAPPRAAEEPAPAVLMPLRLATDAGTISLFSTTTVFGTPLDVTLAELMIEQYFPADAETDTLIRRMDSAERAA